MNKVFYFFVALVLFSCNQSDKPADMPNTPTSGVVKVFCEEGFTIPLKLQAYTFEQIYSNTNVVVKYTNEKEAIEGLFNDSCKVIIISRKLSAEEEKKFSAANLFPKQTCIAKNALAFVVNHSSLDSVISFHKIKTLLSGTDTSLKIVFDNQNSGVTRFLKDSVMHGKDFGKNCFAVKNTDELVKYVSENKNCVGVMDYSWLSDKEETVTQEILKKVRPLAVSVETRQKAYYPDQSNIETRDYPFCRYVYIMRRSADFTLGTGFLVFVAGQKGQLMVLKSGLVPMYRQERVIEVNTSSLQGK